MPTHIGITEKEVRTSPKIIDITPSLVGNSRLSLRHFCAGRSIHDTPNINIVIPINKINTLLSISDSESLKYVTFKSPYVFS